MAIQKETNVTPIPRAKTEQWNLTASKIKKAPARAKRYRVADTNVPGLYLPVEHSGANSTHQKVSQSFVELDIVQ